jgi:hypothetical protein
MLKMLFSTAADAPAVREIAARSAVALLKSDI